MPTVNISLDNTSQSFTRPVVIDIVGQVMAATKIAKDVPIFYGGELGLQQTAGSGVGEEKDRRARFDTLRRLVISADEVYAEDQHVTDVVGKPDNIPVFTDQALGVNMWPTYTTSTMNITFRYETRSKEECLRWRQEMTMKYMMLRTSLMHQITYSWSMPQPVWNVIKDIYDKRDSVAGYGDTFAEYLNQCMTNRLTVIGNENGNQAMFQVTEKQDRIQGFFNFTTDPMKAEYDEKGVWAIEFVYSFTYQRPVGMDFHYPIMVHNQFLEDEFIEYDKAVTIHEQFLNSISGWSMYQYEGQAMMLNIKPEFPYARIPLIDDFSLSGTFPGTGTFALALMKLDPETPGVRPTFNLADMGDVCLDPDVLDFIRKGEYKYIGPLAKSIFHFEVYKDKMPLTAPSISVDKDLEVELLIKPDLRRQYRVRLALFTDLEYIDRQALERLRCHPKAFVKILGAINELLIYRSDFQKLGDQNVIHPWQLTRAWEFVTGSPITNGYGGWTRQTCGSRDLYNDFLAIPKNVRDHYARVKKGMKTVMYQSLLAVKKD